MYDPEIGAKQMQKLTETQLGYAFLLNCIKYLAIGVLLVLGEPDLLGATAHFIHELPTVLIGLSQ